MSEKFDYKYSAPTEEERREIDNIRRQYTPRDKTETKLDRLRKLDSKVKNTAVAVSLCFGIIGCLIFGLGLSMVLEWNMYIWGTVVTIVGVVPIAAAYPVYKYALNKGKQKYAKEILELSDELLNKQSESEQQ